MRLIKSGRVIDDVYTKLLDDSPVPASGAIVVPAARYLADAADFAGREAPTGVIWPNSRDIAELAPYVDRLALIALAFPTFRDGRAYSQARLLRERYGFRGELRATGQILRDQFLFLVRAGFTAFEVSKEADADHFVDALGRYRVFYQAAGDDRVPAALLRLSDAAHRVPSERVR